MHQVALVSGDGIGPEITDSTISVIESTGVDIQWVPAPLGQMAVRQHGQPVPPSSLETIQSLRRALKAPLIATKRSGGVRIEGDRGARTYPSINNALRRELNTFVNLRPVRGWPGVSGRYADMNIVIVREITEDVYVGIERQVDDGTTEAIKRITRGASERIAKFGFEYAVTHARKRVDSVHKANVLHLTDGLFLDSVRKIGQKYPSIRCGDYMVDALCYHLIKSPQSLEVLVLPSQYGDIVSDVAAGLVGSLGLVPGANIGDEVAFFEAAHGAAPDIAGLGIANPIGLILSGAMLLEHLGESDACRAIQAAVATVLEQGRWLTPDVGGTAKTQELTLAIRDAVDKVGQTDLTE